MNFPARKQLFFWILPLIFIIGCFGIFAEFFQDFSLPDSDAVFIGKTQKVTLAPERPVTQVFTATRDGLNQIRIALGDTQNVRQGERIDFELTDDSCKQIIARDHFTIWDREPQVFFPFAFPTQTDSAGHQYCLKITYFGADRRGEKPSLAATDDPDDRFLGVSFTDAAKGKTYEHQSLKIRPAYTNGSLRENLSLLLHRLSQYRPAFIKGWPIALLALGTLIGSIFFALPLILHNEKPRVVRKSGKQKFTTPSNDSAS